MWDFIKKYGIIIGGGIAGAVVFIARIFANTNGKRKELAGRIRANYKSASKANRGAEEGIANAEGIGKEQTASIERSERIVGDAGEDNNRAREIIQQLRKSEQETSD